MCAVFSEDDPAERLGVESGDEQREGSEERDGYPASRASKALSGNLGVGRVLRIIENDDPLPGSDD